MSDENISLRILWSRMRDASVKMHDLRMDRDFEIFSSCADALNDTDIKGVFVINVDDKTQLIGPRVPQNKMQDVTSLATVRVRPSSNTDRHLSL